MNFEIDPNDPAPPYAQLRDQIAEAAANGKLRAGEKLPTVRHLADQLGLAPNTVAKVYRELETAGMIETKGRQGSFVSLDAREIVDELEQNELLEAAARTFATVVKQLKVSKKRAITAFDQHFS